MALLHFELLLPAFALVLARMVGVVLATPMMASAQIPRLIKVLLVFALSLMVFPVVAGKIPGQLGLSRTLVGMAGEFLIGELLGLAAGLTFFAAQMAGKIVSHQAGFALGEVFNPLFDEEFTILDQMWFFATFMFFLALRGHEAVVSVVLRSFEQVPPLMLGSDASMKDFGVGIAHSAFDVALRLAGPALVALLLASIVLGFLTKTMPQMNVLSVGFTLKIVIGIGLVALSISMSQGLMAQTFADGLDRVGRLFAQLAETAHG